MLINERSPLDAFLEMRINYNKGIRQFSIVVPHNDYANQVKGFLERQSDKQGCRWDKKDKIIQVKYV